MFSDIAMDPSTKSLTDALRAARLAAGLSQRALSAKLGIPQSRLSRIENGAIDIRTSTLLELSRALDLEPMLVPRPLVPTIAGLSEGNRHRNSKAMTRPLYRLDEEDDDGE